MAYFLVKVQEKHEDDNGKVKKQSVSYLAMAESVTDAEAKVYKLYEGSVIPFEVKAVSETKIQEVI